MTVITGDKCFRILLLFSGHMLFMMEQILSTRADVPRVELCWLIQCVTGTFWLTDRDAGTKPQNRVCPS